MIDLNNNKNDPFLARLFKNGLSTYTSSAVIQNVEGVESKMLNQYASFLAGNLEIPLNSRQNFMQTLLASAFADRAEWAEFSFIYKLNTKTAKFVQVIVYNDYSRGILDFFICDIKAGFEMAPDVIMSSSTKSILFGMFSKTNIQIVTRPAELTQHSIQLLFKFFKVSALEKFKKFRNIK